MGRRRPHVVAAQQAGRNARLLTKLTKLPSGASTFHDSTDGPALASAEKSARRRFRIASASLGLQRAVAFWLEEALDYGRSSTDAAISAASPLAQLFPNTSGCAAAGSPVFSVKKPLAVGLLAWMLLWVAPMGPDSQNVSSRMKSVSVEARHEGLTGRPEPRSLLFRQGDVQKDGLLVCPSAFVVFEWAIDESGAGRFEADELVRLVGKKLGQHPPESKDGHGSVGSGREHEPSESEKVKLFQ